MITGIELCKQFYEDTICPILDKHFPGLPHAAALIGSGSEVLGFDDAMSTDHDWGPRGMLFVNAEDHQRLAKAIQAALAQHLPYTFHDYSTNFSEPDLSDSGTQLPQTIEQGAINHRVEIWTIGGFLKGYLGFDSANPIEPANWLTFPTQRLRTITAGAVYHDAIGLQVVRDRFAWYPKDVWLYLLAAGWTRIGQEEHLMGRAGVAGDEVGSALIAARLVRDVMRLGFLMEQVHAPYPKWFGTAFKQLACGAILYPILQNVLTAKTWQARQTYLASAYEQIAIMHNQLKLTDPLPEKTVDFFNRPFQVMALHGFADRLLEAIHDPAVQQIAQRRPIGSIDQWSDSTDLLEDVGRCTIARHLYQ